MNHEMTTDPQRSPGYTPDPNGWPDDTVLLVLTYSKMETYIPEVLENLDLFWPNRPDTYVVTDGVYDGDNVIRVSDPVFVHSLDAALRAVRAQLPEKDHVFLLLEDLCPLWEVDETTLTAIQGFVRRDNVKFVSHSWQATRQAPWKNGRWNKPGTVHMEGELKLIRMPSYYRAYNSVAASFWDIEHLEKVVRAKLRRNMVDPWEFERPVNRKQPDHFLVDGAWPTVRHGFYQKGKHNPMIAKRKKMPDSPLLSRLRKEQAA